jgi:hypothetical protein
VARAHVGAAAGAWLVVAGVAVFAAVVELALSFAELSWL